MPLYTLSDTNIHPLEPTSLTKIQQIESGTLHSLFRDRVDLISSDLMVISEEFGDWDSSNRRIDLLCIDTKANLVVIETKISEGSDCSELLAIRNGAMISSMSLEQAVQAHSAYLENRGIEEDARQRIFNFVGGNFSTPSSFGQLVKIILVATEFSKELTTSVLWLNDRGVNIQCIKVKPFLNGNQVLLDLNKVIPLPEVSDFQVRVREQEKNVLERRSSSKKTRYKFTLFLDKEQRSGLNKRNLMYQIVDAVIRRGGTPEEISRTVSWLQNSLFFEADGVLEEREFLEKFRVIDTPGKRSKSIRYFCKQEELFIVRGRTYALSNQWGKRTEEAARLICSHFRHFRISFEKE